MLTTVGALCFGGSSAMAAVVTGTGDSPVYTAGAGAIDNIVTVTQSPDGTQVTFHEDAADPITIDAATTGCVAAADDVTCTAPAAGLVTDIEIDLDDGADLTTLVDVTAAVSQFGGTGNDSLGGGDGLDILSGGDGDDELSGGGGTDVLEGGAGDDTLIGGAGADTVRGGSGRDLAIQTSTAAQTLTLDDLANDGEANEGDNIFSDVEDAATSIGDDTIVGSSADNGLIGDDGNDDITGEGGKDILVGVGGNDTIHARDGEVDTIACGAGTDVVFADANDVIIEDPVSDEHCETVNLPATAPAATTSASTTAGTTTGTTTPAATPPTTGTNTIATTVLVAPRSLSLTASPTRDRKRPYTFTVRGTIALPAGVPKAQGCLAGTVTVTGKRGTKNAFAPKKVKITKACTYSTTLSIARTGRVKLTARFSGNTVLKAKSSSTRTVRAG